VMLAEGREPRDSLKDNPNDLRRINR